VGIELRSLALPLTFIRMGILDDVYEEVTIKLGNGSVVSVYDPSELKIPISGDFSDGVAMASTGKRNSAKLKTVATPAHSAPGLTVITTRPNLWRGRWIYGEYDPSVNPVGVIVDVKTWHLDVNWLCQNMMVTGRFVPVEKPPTRIMWDDEISKVLKFKKSTGGFVDLQGNPFKTALQLSSGGDFLVGERVMFVDLDAAVEKYKGVVKKIPRSEMLGYDVNTFIVVATNTKVRVQWQDMTETVDDCRNLVPYLNVDEHEVWPGEIVVIKPDTSSAAAEKPEGTDDSQRSRERFQGVWEALTSATGVPSGGEEKPEFMKPEKVGVVQSVNPADRTASVKWFVSPNVDVAGGFMIPGSTTGPLQPEAEDVSLYDAVAHQALGVRRGDFVLIAPEHPPQEERPAPASPSLPPPTGDESSSAPDVPVRPAELSPDQMAHVAHFVDSIRGMVDGGLLANLSAALGNHSHPQLQAVSRVLNQFPGLLTNPQGQQAAATRMPNPPSADAADAFADQPAEWLGEVVDLGLDGLVTVRLGALDEPRDVRVPIERLHIIFNESMDLDEGEFDDDEEYSDESDDEDGSSDEDDDDMEYVGMNEPEAIEEKIIYEGGERLDNGGEEDWLTDDDEDFVPNDSDEEMSGVEPAGMDEEMADEPVSRAPPAIPENVPAPEAIQLAPGAPSRFMVLDTEIPSDHAYKDQPAATRTSAMARRIAKEHRILASSLPEGIFVRTWESRLDLLRVLIVGPLNTPYELAPFVFDFHFTNQFPTQPPVGFFHSWTSGVGRVNPNLYEDGKICLSLLGTWHAEKRGEGWSASGSSVLQLLVSLMGLVLVREPWYSMSPPNLCLFHGRAD
jgi:ubiquitin-conjugating enzyme E2 O